MSGVFGIVDAYRRDGLRSTLARMGQEMSHRKWHVSETYVDSQDLFGLGRMGIGIFNPDPQPVWSSDRTVVLALAGEFYKIDAVEKNGAGLPDEHLALDLYQKYGLDFPRHLNGAFIIALFDHQLQRLVIANDRFGLYPLFYTCRDGKLIFAPEMKGVFADPAFPRQFDEVALAQYMRFQHLFGERTFFEDLHLLPTGSVLAYDVNAQTCSLNTYWTYSDIPYRPNISFDEAIEETGRLLRTSVERLSGDRFRPGVYLSGGLDSRTLLGMVKQRPVVSLNYGAAGCRDSFYARQIAAAVGSKHFWVDLPNGNWVKDHADFHLDLTEGYHSWIHAHGINTLDLARQHMDVNLSGWDGGSVMGIEKILEPRQVKAVDDTALLTRLFHVFNQTYTWPSIDEGEEHLLYCSPLSHRLQGLAFESFREELKPFLAYRRDVRTDLFSIHQHTFRLTRNMITMSRSSIEVRFPYFDYDLFDFLHSLPSEMRGPRRLFRSVIQRETPRLARIPYDHDEVPPTLNRLIRGSHKVSVRAKRKFNQLVFPFFPDRHTLYADYEGYLRTDLRQWAQDILFSPSLEQRGIFSPAFLRTLMSRHLSGIEEWTVGKIAPVITYELMLRRFYDQS